MADRLEKEATEGGRTALVTGAAGFIGYYLSRRLLEEGWRVVGLDNVNDYYDPGLKEARLALLRPYEGWRFVRADLADAAAVRDVFEEERPRVVVNLAAQAGVRYSIDHPEAYIQSNIVGFQHVLEACRSNPVDHLIYASSSSVYGANRKVPFEETDPVDHPVSLYAATKKANELMAHTYSHLYGIPATGLRFFTVYGPLGRPDMAYFGFADKHFAGEEIAIYNNGDFAHDLYRDFTYIDDIVEGIVRLLPHAPRAGDGGAMGEGAVNDGAGDGSRAGTGSESDEAGTGAKVQARAGVNAQSDVGAGAGTRGVVGFRAGSGAPHVVYNIGNNRPEKLMTFVGTLEKALSRSLGRPVAFRKRFEPIKPGDVPETYASTERLERAVGFKPSTSIEEGLQRFADWYVRYYGVK